MTDTDQNETELALWFDAAKRDPVPVPAGLAGRVLADAARVQDGFWPGRLRQLRMLLGGWAGLGGLAAACAAGVWIGLAPPVYLPDPMLVVQAQRSEIDVMNGDGLVRALSQED